MCYLFAFFFVYLFVCLSGVSWRVSGLFVCGGVGEWGGVVG